MISVIEAIEELLYTKGGLHTAHRHKIAELLVAQEAKILELTDGEEKDDNSEPPYPEKCSNCGMSYDACNDRLIKTRPCCGKCSYTATHNQTAWEGRKDD